MYSLLGVLLLSKVIIVTSFKGGVGKTTVSANLAMTLAMRGKKVVAIDCDLESRCLDIVLGLEDLSLYNISDIISGRCKASEAIVVDPRCENLHFIAAPAYYDFLDNDLSLKYVNDDSVANFIRELQAEYDFVVLDLPARPDNLYRSLIKVATHALVVSLHTAASIRAAEKTAMMLSDMTSLDDDGSVFEGVEGGFKHPSKLKTRLVINCFRPDAAANGIRPRIYEIVMKASTKLLGVIPLDEKVAAAQEHGLLAFQVRKGNNSFNHAMKNIAARCDGEHILLLKDVKTGKSREKLI